MKCPRCKGQGKFSLSKERILAAPRYIYIKCPDCNGTGEVEAEYEATA